MGGRFQSDVVRRIATGLIEALPEGEPIDLVPALTDVMPGLVILSVLGIDLERQEIAWKMPTGKQPAGIWMTSNFRSVWGR